jgi:hypothetical protein
MIMAKVDKLIDQFAAKLAASEHVAIQRVLRAPWTAELQNKLPKRFPRSFGSLISRYAFPAFDLWGIAFFGNTGAGNETDLEVAIFKDRGLCEVLLSKEYVQIGRPDTGDYDPVCFDPTGPINNREYPIVRIDHEEILCNCRIKVTSQIAPSFFKLVEQFLAAK